MSRFLITGSSGFIFTHVTRKLLEDKSNFVLGVDCLYDCASKVPQQTNEHGNFVFEKCNINNTQRMLELLIEHKIDTVIHAAAQSHVDNSFENVFQFVEDNVRGTLSVLEAVRRVLQQHNQQVRVIQISSDEVYGSVKDGTPRHELSLLAPTNLYAASKASTEQVAMAYATSYAIPIIIVRANNVFAGGQHWEKCIPRFISLLSQGKAITIQGNGLQKRSFLYVDDFVNALLCILEKGEVGEVYNIAAECELTILELASRIAEAMSVSKDELKLVFVKDRPFNDSRYFVSDTRLRSLGWRPKISFEEGLRRTVKWYVSADRKDYFVGDYAAPELDEIDALVTTKRQKTDV